MFQYSQALHKRIEEAASDEEMIVLIENFVARIEVFNNVKKRRNIFNLI